MDDASLMRIADQLSMLQTTQQEIMKVLVRIAEALEKRSDDHK